MSDSNYSGVSIFPLLTVTFVALKLTGHIDWHWAYVLAPSWVPAAILLAIAAIAVLVSFIAWMFK